MASRSSSSPREKSVSVIVSFKTPLSFSNPIWGLAQSSYSSSKIRLFLIGETRHFQNTTVLKGLNFKYVKVISRASQGSIYAQAARFVKEGIVLFTVSDCCPDRDWIKETLSAFKEDPRIALVLGEVQWRKVNPQNKVEQYCEQTGLGSAGQMLGCETASYLSWTKERVLEYPALDQAVSLLSEPMNVAIRSSALSLMAKSPYSNRRLTSSTLRPLMDKDVKVFYQPAIVESFISMDIKKLNRLMFDKACQKAAWGQIEPAKFLRFRVHLWKNHELKLPFWFSIDISWGDFHWINFWGIWLLWEFSRECFITNFTGTFWNVDRFLLIFTIFGFFSFRYFLPLLKIQPWSDFILWCWIKYRSNMSMFLGGLWASLKFKCFYWAESW